MVRLPSGRASCVLLDTDLGLRAVTLTANERGDGHDARPLGDLRADPVACRHGQRCAMLQHEQLYHRRHR